MEAALNSPYGRTMLGPTGMTIGRSPDNQLVISDPQASSHHAQIYPEGQGYLLVDLGSTNGTFLNEQRLIPHSPRMLNSGDALRIGNTSFSYEAVGTPSVGQTVPGQYGGPAYEQTVIGLNPVPPAPPQAYPQQPYAPAPGQVGFPDVAQQPQKKSRLGLWIALIVILLLVVAGGVSGYAYLNRSTPTRTLQNFCTALKASPPDYQTAYNQFSARYRARESEQAFATGLQQSLNNPILGGLKDCMVSNVQENGSTATGGVTFSFNRVSQTLAFNFNLVNESDGWKIDNGTFKVVLAA